MIAALSTRNRREVESKSHRSNQWRTALSAPAELAAFLFVWSGFTASTTPLAQTDWQIFVIRMGVTGARHGQCSNRQPIVAPK
jgi:hypothetical protein